MDITELKNIFRDRFGQVGTVDFLAKEYGLTAEVVCEEVKKTIARK